MVSLCNAPSAPASYYRDQIKRTYPSSALASPKLQQSFKAAVFSPIAS